MKQYFGMLGIWLLFVGILYAAFSFVAWQFNPQHWTESSRFYYALLSVISIAPIYNIIKESAKKKKYE